MVSLLERRPENMATSWLDSESVTAYTLVCFEAYDPIRRAIVKEQAIKKWNGAWKLELIEKSAPTWLD